VIWNENQQSSTTILTFFGFFPFHPSVAGSVVIGRLSAAAKAFVFNGIAPRHTFSRSPRIQPEFMLRQAENQRPQCPTVVLVSEKTPAKPELSKSSNNFPGDGLLSLIWAMKTSNDVSDLLRFTKQISNH
jgi:hypothetical protein